MLLRQNVKYKHSKKPFLESENIARLKFFLWENGIGSERTKATKNEANLEFDRFMQSIRSLMASNKKEIHSKVAAFYYKTARKLDFNANLKKRTQDRKLVNSLDLESHLKYLRAIFKMLAICWFHFHTFAENVDAWQNRRTYIVVDGDDDGGGGSGSVSNVIKCI